MEPLALFNGELRPQSQVSLSLNDAGFVFGATVTDLARTIRRTLYRWPDHRARFRRSCAAIEVVLPYPDDQLDTWARELVAHNAGLLDEGEELALVAFATPGPIGYYLGEPGGVGDAPPTVGMHTFPLPFARYRGLVERGAALAVTAVPHLPAACVDRQIKHRNRLHWLLADIEVRRTHPGAQALLRDETGGVTETAAANFLLVKRGTVVSPPADRVLDGVSLQVARELCGRLDIPFLHRHLTPDECRAADEALLTSTPYGLVGVREIDGAPLPFPGPVTRRLMDVWNADVGLDLHGQIREAGGGG